MIARLTDLDDPRLVPFKGMRTANWTVGSGWFIAEGPRLVERLLRSSFAVHSLLISDKYLGAWLERIPNDAQALVVSEDLISQLLGFNFHRGVVACGLRKEPLALRDSLSAPLDRAATLVAVHGVQDPENLGGILRSCAALGIEHILIGPKSADPLCRRVLRVSMGTVLNLKLYPSPDLQSDLDWLRSHHDAQTVATTLGEGSEPLEQATRTSPLVVMLGNEAHGLPLELQQAADRRVRIDMRLGTDSLNVSVAAGIILHHFSRVAR